MITDSNGTVLNEGDRVSMGEFFTKNEEVFGTIVYDRFLDKMMIKGEGFDCDIDIHRKRGSLVKA